MILRFSQALKHADQLCTKSGRKAQDNGKSINITTQVVVAIPYFWCKATQIQQGRLN
jgi:hypothetical protein